MTQRKMILALIGRGKWGQNYIKTIPQIPECTLPSQNIKTSNYADLLKKKGINGVIIASPTATHYTIAKAFLEKGFNILIEKPITKTYRQAVKIQKITLMHPKQIVMAGHIQLYNPGYILLKKILPKIGVITALEYYGLQSTPRTDTTVIEDWGPHPTYLFIDILGDKPQSVRTTREKQGQIKLTYCFDNITGNAYIAWKSKVKKRQLIVLGNTGKIILDDLTKTVTLIKSTGSCIYQIDQQVSPLKLEIKKFIAAIRSGDQPKSDIKQAISVMKIINQFQLFLP